MKLLSADRRNQQQHDKQAESPDGFGKFIIIDRFLNVDVAPEFMASLDLASVVCGGEHDDRKPVQDRIGLQPAQHLDAIDFGHPDVEEDEEGSFLAANHLPSRSKKKSKIA